MTFTRFRIINKDRRKFEVKKIAKPEVTDLYQSLFTSGFSLNRQYANIPDTISTAIKTQYDILA
jgi:ribosomal protein S17E